ncbi:flagellar hook-associated protein 3 [Heliorestis convoluta]|uniref:Flagellin n=2 Tax=Heliorestis convoluta TaxID=356322 RepID=A0A5Q2N4S1_9FIRM|nr:flagellar hook-associated protein 3 [Heliorestis convoluta]
MIINSNIAALNAFNKLKKNNSKTSTAMEKLSSGLRINKAGDDPAGLAISEKMRAQIRGLVQAQRNILDGISLVQVAEGGMSEIHSSLQRIRELSVQSSNGTYTDEDRNSMQIEVTQLINQVSTIANNTEFNGLPLLSGQYDKGGNKVALGSLDQYVQYITTTGGITDTYTYGSNNYASAIIDFSNINSANDVYNLVGKGVYYTCCTCSKAYSIKFVDGNPDTSRLNDPNPVMEVDVSAITNGTDLVDKIIETAYGQSGFVYDPTSNSGIPTIGTHVPSNATSFVTHFSQLAADGGKLYIYDNRPTYATWSWPSSNGRGAFELNVYGESEEERDLFLHLNIQAGSQSGHSTRISIPNVTAKHLNIDHLSVASEVNANAAITMIDHAISRVSSARTTVGAYQNRLEHSLANASNYEIRLTSAESLIRDTDMAKQMMEMTKNNILSQVSQSMLAQANLHPQSVLQLLQ